MEGHKVAYPSRDDPEAVEIVHSDLLRLAPEEFLNDTVIDFYIKYDGNSVVAWLYDTMPLLCSILHSDWFCRPFDLNCVSGTYRGLKL